MNLNIYDNVTEKLDKTKTWIDIRKKIILSREIKYRPYTCLVKKFIPITGLTQYYIAILQSPPENIDYKHTIVDSYGRIKIRISKIWNDTYLPQLKSNCNIDIDLVESDVDGEIYFLDI